jgi:hypothetical protein
MSTELPLLQSPLPACDMRAEQPVSLWWPLLMFVLPLACADFAIVPLMRFIQPRQVSSVLVYSCFGLIPAQGALLSIGLVFGNDRYWRRLLIHWGCVLLLTFCWSIGFLLTNRQGHEVSMRLLEEAARGICALPLISLAIQLPLWLAHKIFGWRLEGHSQIRIHYSLRGLLAGLALVGITLGLARYSRPNPRAPEQFWFYWFTVTVFALGLGAAVCHVLSTVLRSLRKSSEAAAVPHDSLPVTQVSIRDLLLTTAMIAVTLGIARAAPMSDAMQANPQHFWLQVGMFAAASAGVSLLGVLPLVAMFRARIPLPFAWILAIGYALGYWVFFVLLSASGLLGWPRIEVQRTIGVAVSLVAFAGGIAGGLSLLRLHGVEFTSGRSAER